MIIIFFICLFILGWVIVYGLKYRDILHEEHRRKWIELAGCVKREWSIERLLADERVHGRQEANGDWLSCLIGRAGDTSYGELAGPILNVSDTLTRFIEAERERVRAILYDQWAQVSQVIISRIGNAIEFLNDGQIGRARDELIIAEDSIGDCAKRIRQLDLTVPSRDGGKGES